jgi:hypothetical protein
MKLFYFKFIEFKIILLYDVKILFKADSGFRALTQEHANIPLMEIAQTPSKGLDQNDFPIGIWVRKRTFEDRERK